jgi:uncharacterized alkaline shock family protein YloU
MVVMVRNVPRPARPRPPHSPAAAPPQEEPNTLAKVGSGMRELRTDLGRLVITEEAVAAIAGAVALETPGIAGMAPRGLADILGRDPHPPVGRGVEVTPQGDAAVDLALDVAVAFGVRIHEVAEELERRLRRDIPALTGISVHHVAVRIQAVRPVDRHAADGPA